MEKSFIFVSSYASFARETFIKDKIEGVNYIQALKPNTGFNLYDQLYLLKFPDPCATFKNDSRKRRLDKIEVKKGMNV